jgi:hypothetical protein
MTSVMSGGGANPRGGGGLAALQRMPHAWLAIGGVGGVALSLLLSEVSGWSARPSSPPGEPRPVAARVENVAPTIERPARVTEVIVAQDGDPERGARSGISDAGGGTPPNMSGGQRDSRSAKPGGWRPHGEHGGRVEVRRGVGWVYRPQGGYGVVSRPRPMRPGVQQVRLVHGRLGVGGRGGGSRAGGGRRGR